MGSLRSTLPTLAAVLLLVVLPSLPVLAHGNLPSSLSQDAIPLAGQSASAATPGQRAAAVDPAGILPSLPWERVNQVVPVSGTTWNPLILDGAVVDRDGPVRGSMQFWCPPSDGGTSVANGANTFTIRATCPYRIIDDSDLLGSAQIAVKASDPNAMAFFSLHGASSTEGPSPRSRDPSPDTPQSLTGQSHTTFTSQDHGRAWFDNPWGTDGFGEHVSGVMDTAGNMYIAATWSKRLGDGDFDFIIKTYKEQDGRFEISNYQPSKTFANRAAGNVIDQANLVFVPAQSIFPAANMTGNGTGNVTGPSGAGDIGNFTDPDAPAEGGSPGDRVMLVWHETALDWRNSTTGKSAWIDAAWTDTTSRNNWTRLANERLIGPCMEASNPVQWNGKAYVACVVDAGYKARSRARIGDVDVWSIDPMTGLTELVDTTQLHGGGQPRMTARDDGFMALTNTKVISADNVEIDLRWSWYGRQWNNGGSIGGTMHRLASNTLTAGLPPGTPSPPPASNKVEEARITAMALSEKEDMLFLVYMERVDVGNASDPDPNNPFISPDSAIEYKKLVATFTLCDPTPGNVYDLQLGQARHPFPEAIAANSGVFDDSQDGMQFWRDPVTGEERIYFAYGDHGVIQFGALVTSGSPPLTICPNPVPPPFFPAQVIPAGLTATSPYTTLIGSTVGLTATAMIGYLLTVKRKSANALAAKAKK